MKKMLFAFSMAGILLLSACGRPAAEETEAAETTAEAERAQETSGVLVIEDAGEDKNKNNLRADRGFLEPGASRA